MSKLIKDLVTGEYQSRYSGVESLLWVELIGADGLVTNEFRRELRNKKMRLQIVKNSMFRRAFGDGPLSALARSLAGPSALISGGDSVMDVAKVVETWLPKLKGLRLRGAVLEGQYINEDRVKDLSKMPGKRDLQARVAGMALSPGAKLASAIQSGGGNIAGCVKALIEKLEQAEAPTPAAA